MPKLHATIRVTVFLLDSLFPAGYGYEREQARGGVRDEAMQIPLQAEGEVGFISTVIRGARRRGPSSPSTVCSHKRKAREMVKVIRRLRKFPYACSL